MRRAVKACLLGRTTDASTYKKMTFSNLQKTVLTCVCNVYYARVHEKYQSYEFWIKPSLRSETTIFTFFVLHDWNHYRRFIMTRAKTCGPTRRAVSGWTWGQIVYRRWRICTWAAGRTRTSSVWSTSFGTGTPVHRTRSSTGIWAGTGEPMARTAVHLQRDTATTGVKGKE